MSALKIKDVQGNWIEVPMIKGDKGDKGDTYTLTEQDKQDIADLVNSFEIHICSSAEYDSITRIPTIQTPDEKTFYLVPNEDGTSPDLFVEWAYVNNAWEMFGSASIDLSGYLTNVTVGGNSVVTNGVANIPIISGTNTLGLARINSIYGITADSNGVIGITKASSGYIKDGDQSFTPIVPKNQHEATFYGLAKASGDSTQSASSNAVGTYTDEAKASIQTMLGVPSVDDIPVDTVVTFTIPWVNNDYGDGGTADKTFTEIKTALLNGEHVIGKLYLTDGNETQFRITLPIVEFIEEGSDSFIVFSMYNTMGRDMDFATINSIHTVFMATDGVNDFVVAKKIKDIATEKYVKDAINNIPNPPVEDVQINGTSILADGVANIPKASDNQLGCVMPSPNYGISIFSGGGLILNKAPDEYIKNGGGTYGSYRAIASSQTALSTFHGLALASGDITQKTSTNTLGQYTPEAKGAIQSMLGIDSLIAPTETNPFIEAHAIGDLFIINGALYRAKTAIAVGDVLDDGVNVEGVNVDDVAVKDVQINGNSVINNGIADIPIGTLADFGIVKIGSGLDVNNGLVTTNPAVSSDIKEATANYKQIVPSKQHEAVFYGLAKASGDTTQSQSSNAVGQYTDEAKQSIKQMLGVVDSYDSLVVNVTGTDPIITGSPSYRYNCGEVTTLTITPPSSGTIDIIFTSGTTPTVLDLPQTVKMPSWWVGVEANTTYEMCITDGVYCGVMSWDA